MPVQAAVAAVGVGTQVAQTVASIQDMNKRRQFEQNLSMLDNQQRLDLEKALQRSTSLDNKMAILTNAISNIRSAQTTTILSSTINAKSKQEMTTAILLVGGAVAVLIGIVILKKKS